MNRFNQPTSQCGRIDLILGPMFAGKTTELMRRVKRDIHARRKCFVIKYSGDKRYSDTNVANHDQMVLKAMAMVDHLEDVGNLWESYDVIAIDEGQFFPDLVSFCTMVADKGKTVYVSALDGDYQRKPFGKVCELIPHCEHVDKLAAVCMMCHQHEGNFTRRTVSSDKQELIGGADMYVAACRKCYNQVEPPTPRKMGRVRDAIREVEVLTMGAVSCKVAVGGPALPATTSPDGHSPNAAAESTDEPAAKRLRAESP